jgi:hypothetical protein
MEIAGQLFVFYISGYTLAAAKLALKQIFDKL